jgi:hypothetical protein
MGRVCRFVEPDHDAWILGANCHSYAPNPIRTIGPHAVARCGYVIQKITVATASSNRFTRNIPVRPTVSTPSHHGVRIAS